MPITVADITFSIKGFYITKITKNLSDNTLRKIEEEISENVHSVIWANVEYIGYLCVSWQYINSCNKEQQEKVCKIINKIVK